MKAHVSHFYQFTSNKVRQVPLKVYLNKEMGGGQNTREEREKTLFTKEWRIFNCSFYFLQVCVQHIFYLVPTYTGVDSYPLFASDGSLNSKQKEILDKLPKKTQTLHSYYKFPQIPHSWASRTTWRRNSVKRVNHFSLLSSKFVAVPVAESICILIVKE